jgi:hypothetical protein
VVWQAEVLGTTAIPNAWNPPSTITNSISIIPWSWIKKWHATGISFDKYISRLHHHERA